MDPVARRTRGQCEANLLARHREWKEKERKEKEKKEKEKKEQEKKEKIVAMEVDDDDEESDSLEIVGEGSLTGPPKKSSSYKASSSSQSKRNSIQEKDDVVLNADSSKSAGSKRSRSSSVNKNPGKVKSQIGSRNEAINCSSDSDSVEKARSAKNLKSAKGKAEFGERREVIIYTESDSDSEVRRKAKSPERFESDNIVYVGEKPNPCPSARPKKNWKRFIRSERARIESNGMEAEEESDQIISDHNNDKSSGSQKDGSDDKQIASESSSGSEFFSSEEDPDDSDYSAKSSSDNDSGTSSHNASEGKMDEDEDDTSVESISSDSDSGTDSDDNGAKVKKMDEDGIMRVLHVGSKETFREGKGSVMMVDPYDAMTMDRFYNKKREQGSAQKRFGSRRVHSRSDSQPKKNKVVDSSDEDGFGGGSGSYQVSKKSEKLWKKKAGKKKYKKKASAENIKNAINLLLAKTLLDEDGSSDDFGAPCFDKVPTQLPLKFRFEDEDPAPPPEKEPWEIERDNLFAELDIGLTSVYSADAYESVSSSKRDDTEETLSAKSPLERCRLGHHVEVLDEPTGIICKCCQLVLQEMKYIFPDLMMPTSKRRDSFYLGRDDFCEYSHDDIPLGDSFSEKYLSSIQTEGSVLDLIPSNTRKSMYPHQLDGYVFLWKNVVGETDLKKLEELQSIQGSGCIISHAPGTGKTCLSIVFIMTLLKAFPYPECRPVIVAPKSMLLTWQNEFEKWDFGFPFHNLNNDELSGKEIKVSGLDRMVSGLDRNLGTHYVRKLKLCSWKRQRSILGVSYGLFEKIVNGPEKQFLLENPGLVVLDEGHTPRNKNSCMWKALKEVKTRKRIILSGTPFQNSFKELQTTLHLVNADLGSNSDFNWKTLKDAIDTENGHNIAKLKALIDPLVHVYTGDILKQKLPGLKDMLVILRPSFQQKRAFQAISDNLYHFDKNYLVSLVSVHPSLAADKRECFKPESSLEFLDDPSPDAGVKTKFVIQLLKLCDALGEKVLIFSEFIDPLKYLKKKFRDELSWIEGKQVLYMDGKQEAKMRQSSISTLNDPNSEVKVLLASTKTCSEGIHLVGASRVVLLDVVWNPSVERQAISRAFRLGQTKVVYVYHLITMGTLEVHKHEMQTRKHRLSELVFSSRDLESKKTNISAAVAEDKLLQLMMDDKIYKDMFEEIVHV